MLFLHDSQEVGVMTIMNVEKRYQVFISSTFLDLLEERQSVLKAVLELNHMPAGMELFPASDESAWQLICDVIDGSDYYVLIVGGKYGSLDEKGVGYTEKEYDYAYSHKIPVIPFLHKNPDAIPRGKTETENVAWEKLKAFRKKVEDKHTCSYWESQEELKSKVIVGLTSIVKRHPAVGWIRADQIPSGVTIVEIFELRNKISELEQELERSRTEPPHGTENLLQQNDHFAISLDFLVRQYESFGGKRYKTTINPTWNDMFASVAPGMINEVTDEGFRKSFKKFAIQYIEDAFRNESILKDKEVGEVYIKQHDIDTFIIQLRALGLIQHSVRKRSIKDTSTYWTLTRYGDMLMVQLRALKKETASPLRTAEKAEPSSSEGD